MCNFVGIDMTEGSVSLRVLALRFPMVKLHSVWNTLCLLLMDQEI